MKLVVYSSRTRGFDGRNFVVRTVNTMNIRLLCCSISFFTTLFDVIHRLQNSFVPIVYDTHVWHLLYDNLLQPLQKPIPIITILSPLQTQ
jgi:hypothetical protein